MALTRREFCLAAVAAWPEVRGYYGGFRIALQSWSYRRFSLDETITRVGGLGVRYLELSPAHADFARLSTPEVREVKRKLLDAGLSVHTYGVPAFDRKNRRELEITFRRAQEFGLPALVLEPAPELLKEVDELAGRYCVQAAIRNSYQGAFESPAAVWEAIGQRPHCGAAIDTGNFLSAGHDPVAAIAKLKGRVLCVHLKDIARPGEVTVLGKGRADVPAILRALRAQEYDEVIAFEYDAHPEDPGAGIEASLEYLQKITKAM